MVTRFRRYGQIADVLIKYGFGIVITDLFPGIQRIRLRWRSPDERRSIYERIRLAIEELGPTFVKFGQIMSTREELLPPPLIEELRKLQDQVRPVPFSEIRPVLLERCPQITEWFSMIEEEPVASASLAQVHRAILRDGTRVAMKIQRPGIEELIETDLAILASLAARLESVIPESRIYNPVGMVQDFAAQIRKELDFIRDGRNAERLAANFAGVEGIRFPKIYWDYSSRHVLVMEFIDGVRVDDIEAIRTMHVDPAVIAKRGFRAYLKQIFQDGFFHGDPHAGNLLVTPKGDIVFLDFGVVGVLRPEKRYLFIRLLYGIINSDVDLVLNALERLGVTIREEDREALRDEVYVALLDAKGIVIGQYSFHGMVTSLTEILRRHQLRVPVNLMLMLKVIVMILDYGAKLDPKFSFNENTEPFLDDLLRTENLPAQILNRAAHTMLDAADGFFDMPRNMNQALKRLSSGTMKLEIIETDIRKLQHSMDRASDKVLIGLVTSAVVVGSSLVLLISNITLPSQVSWLAIIGYTVAVLIGFYALYHVIFSRFRDES
jgi:ubiquinone biosynthesis protein